MMPIDSKNTGETSRLQRPNLHYKYLRQDIFSVKFGLCNLGFSYTFLESTGIIHTMLCTWFLGNISALALSEVQANSEGY